MKTSIKIDVPARQVWTVISTLDSYKNWNPFFVEASGELKEGKALDLQMQPVGGKKREFAPKLLAVTDGREIIWRGRFILPGLFDGTHHLALEPLNDNQTLFTQAEEFSGILVPFVDFMPFRKGWQKMDEALKAECENKK